MISVVIPTLNEAKTIEGVIRLAKSDGRVSEVIVVDDGSIDGTPDIACQAGARIMTSSFLGKGVSFQEGLEAAQNDIIVLLDGDLSDLIPDLVDRLVSSLLSDSADFVKARFTRSAGRVTTLTAKPLLKIFFPELASIEQPLGGIIAGKKSWLKSVELEADYGVDLGLLIDLAMSGARIVEIDIGEIRHDCQDLNALAGMANQVTRTLFRRAEKYGRFRIEQLMAAEDWERRENACMLDFPKNDQAIKKVALFDMDGTLLQGRFIVDLAATVGRSSELEKLLDHPVMHPVERTQAIAQIFAGIPLETFIDVAKNIPLQTGAVECIRELKKRGFGVGIITDSYRAAAETIRRRVFADFSLAHVLDFRNGITTGGVNICPAMYHAKGCLMHLVCKKNALLHITFAAGIPLSEMLTVGDGDNDICMLRSTGHSVAFRPQNKRVQEAAELTLEDSLMSIIPMVDAWLTRTADAT